MILLIKPDSRSQRKIRPNAPQTFAIRSAPRFCSIRQPRISAFATTSSLAATSLECTCGTDRIGLSQSRLPRAKLLTICSMPTPNNLRWENFQSKPLHFSFVRRRRSMTKPISGCATIAQRETLVWIPLGHELTAQQKILAPMSTVWHGGKRALLSRLPQKKKPCHETNRRPRNATKADDVIRFHSGTLESCREQVGFLLGTISVAVLTGSRFRPSRRRCVIRPKYFPRSQNLRKCGTSAGKRKLLTCVCALPNALCELPFPASVATPTIRRRLGVDA